jgi:molybdenum cofactor cytidylyltransferase
VGIAGVILGAGASVRLGQPKQLLPFQGTTLLGWAVRQAEASSLDRVLVVVRSDEVAASLHPQRAEIVRLDGDDDRACSASMHAGLDAAGATDTDAGTDAIALLLGDMPGLTAEIIDAVLDQWRAQPTPAAVTSYTDGLGHPFVFGADAFPDLRALHGDKAVWKLVDAGRARPLPVDAPLPRDVDTWEDYRQIVT